MSFRKLVPFVSRRFSTTTRRQADIVDPGYKDFKAKQELFQREDGIPVHLKKGGIDRVLYGTTVILCVVGTIGSFSLFYRMAFPSK